MRAAEELQLLNRTMNDSVVDSQCQARKFFPRSIISSAVVRVDNLFFLMPFAVASSVSTLLWTHLSHDHVLNESVQWDEHLDPACAWYELAYCVELMCVCFAYTGVLSDGATDVELYYTIIASGGTLSVLAATARFTRAPETEAVFTLLIVAFSAMVFGTVFTRILTVTCTLSLIVALAFALHVLLVAVVHVTARGERLASTIIAARTLTSLLGGYTLIIVYTVGKDFRV